LKSNYDDMNRIPAATSGNIFSFEIQRFKLLPPAWKFGGRVFGTDCTTHDYQGTIIRLKYFICSNSITAATGTREGLWMILCRTCKNFDDSRYHLPIWW